LPKGEFELTHFSGNDGTLEGMVHRALPVLSCQYHPESSPGPHDSRVWFRAFADLVAARIGQPVGVAAAPSRTARAAEPVTVSRTPSKKD
ncbi:MAG: glutamine amidotransferase-related protein, partial [bacterium]